MFTVTKIFEFEAAHRLHQHHGQCKNLHGHSYKLEVEVRLGDGEKLNGNNMVVDFGHLKGAVQAIVDLLDHSYLNDVLGDDMPTAELLLVFVRDQTKWPKDVHPVRLRLWETSSSYAEWRSAGT